MIIIDNFLESYAELKEKSINGQFGDIQSPADGVTYPNIFIEIPDNAKKEVQIRLDSIFGKVNINYIFMRRSPAGTYATQIAHTDNCMGEFTMILYLSDSDFGGTALIRHRATGMAYAPEEEGCVDIARRDQNDLDKWAIYDKAVMKENRAAIFDAHLFHCSLPIGGFGQGDKSRCIMAAFFSVTK